MLCDVHHPRNMKPLPDRHRQAKYKHADLRQDAIFTAVQNSDDGEDDDDDDDDGGGRKTIQVFWF